MAMIVKVLKEIAKQLEIRNAYIEREVKKEVRRHKIEKEDIKLKEHLEEIEEKYGKNI